MPPMGSDRQGRQVGPFPSCSGRHRLHGMRRCPSICLAGDTVLTQTVREFVIRHQPQVSVIPAGDARFDVGGASSWGWPMSWSSHPQRRRCRRKPSGSDQPLSCLSTGTQAGSRRLRTGCSFQPMASAWKWGHFWSRRLWVDRGLS